MSEQCQGFQTVSGNEGEVVIIQEKQMSNHPDPAAVRASSAVLELLRRFGHGAMDTDVPAIRISANCALPQGRELAEAVLRKHGPYGDDLGKGNECPCSLCRLARAYLDALDGKTVTSAEVTNDNGDTGKKPQRA